MRAAVVLFVLLVMLAGCAANGGGTSGSAPTATDRAGAPPIASPRDLTSRAAQPCASLLDPRQLRRLGLPAVGEPIKSALGSPACSWRSGGSGKRADVTVVLQRDLFVDSYRRRVLPIFRPLEIDGLPAVDLQSFPGAPTCTTTVGVADNQSLDITALAAIGRGGRPATDPCEEGHRVAEAIVSTLPPK